MKTFVLDSSALMAFFEGRAGSEKVEQILAQAVARKHALFMSVVNWGEVYYAIWRIHGEAGAREKIKQISQLPVAVVSVTLELAEAAARLKAMYHMPYADCFAASLALARKAAVVTADRDFEAVGKLIRIVWIEAR